MTKDENNERSDDIPWLGPNGYSEHRTEESAGSSLNISLFGLTFLATG